MKEGDSPFQPCKPGRVEICHPIDHLDRIRQPRAFQDNQVRPIVSHELRDSPREIFLCVTTDAASGQIHDLLSYAADAWSVNTDLTRFVHEHTGSLAFPLPIFQQADQKRGFSCSKRSAENVEGNGSLCHGKKLRMGVKMVCVAMTCQCSQVAMHGTLMGTMRLELDRDVCNAELGRDAGTNGPQQLVG